MSVSPVARPSPRLSKESVPSIVLEEELIPLPPRRKLKVGLLAGANWNECACDCVEGLLNSASFAVDSSWKSSWREKGASAAFSIAASKSGDEVCAGSTAVMLLEA